MHVSMGDSRIANNYVRNEESGRGKRKRWRGGRGRGWWGLPLLAL